MIIELLVLCVVIWLLYSYVLPSLPEPIRTPAVIIVAVVLIIGLLSMVGFGSSLGLHHSILW